MSHINKKGNPYIIDISNKDVTERVAVASGEIKFDKETYKTMPKQKHSETQILLGLQYGAKTLRKLC